MTSEIRLPNWYVIVRVRVS